MSKPLTDRRPVGWAWWFPKTLHHKPKVHMLIQRGVSVVALCGQVPWGTCVAISDSDKEPLEKCTVCIKRIKAAQTGTAWTKVIR